MSANPPVIAVVLAAGLGKRFKSDRPKVLVDFNGRPLVHWLVDAVRGAGIDRVVLVIGHHGELVEQSLGGERVEFVWQRELLGTGHAVLQTEPLLGQFGGDILVAVGDAPCLGSQTIRNLLTTHTDSGAAATVLTADVPDPSGYGRIVRATDGTVERLVEHRDADEKTRAIREINSGTICFRAGLLFPALHGLTNTNTQGEYYLTDTIGLLRRQGHTVVAHRADDYREVLGVNSPEELAGLLEYAFSKAP